MTNAEIRIRSCYDSLSETGQKAADYFLAHPQDIYSVPVAQLAKASGVSSAAWVRLCKDLGYTGLKDMRKHLYLESRAQPEDDPGEVHFTDLQDGGDAEQILNAVVAASVAALQNTAALLEPEKLRAAADLLRQADSVMLFGMGASGLVAADLYDKLLRIGKHAVFSADSHVQLVYSATLTKRDAAVFFSNSGRTTEVLESLRAAQESGCRTIGITHYAKSPLAAGCDLVLYTTSSEVYVRSGATGSRLAQLMTVDALFTVLASADYAAIRRPLENSYRLCQTHRSDG